MSTAEQGGDLWDLQDLPIPRTENGRVTVLYRSGGKSPKSTKSTFLPPDLEDEAISWAENLGARFKAKRSRPVPKSHARVHRPDKT